MTETYIGTTVVEHRREFMENCQYGKQIDEFLEQQNRQKRPQATKPILLGLKYEKSENQISNFEKVKNLLNVRPEFLCIIGHTLFKTSSRGSEMKQKRFGVQLKNTLKRQS